MGLFSRIKDWFGDSKPDTKPALIAAAWKHVEAIGSNGDVYEHMDRSNDVALIATDNKMVDSHRYRLEIHIQAHKVR